MEKALTKPILRGYLHQEAFYVALGACTLLIARSSDSITLWSSIVYSIGLLMLLGFSAIYHRIHWEPRARAFLKRIDHSAIFLLIAGTTTPVALLALPDSAGKSLLWLIWTAAFVGIIQSIFWITAPKWFTALLCVVVGSLSTPYIGEIKDMLTSAELFLLVGGGVLYTIGAAFYAIKKPNFFPGVFGYHELFHGFTIVAAILHFILIYHLVAQGPIS